MSYYKIGDQFKWFIGRVFDINDHLKLGRVKVRIIGDQTGDFEDSIPEEDLLWAWPISAIQSASLHKYKIREIEEYPVPHYMGGIGLSPTGIAEGTYVYGFYLDGHEQNIPMIFGTYHKYSQVPGKKGEDGEEWHDVSPLARGQWDPDWIYKPSIHKAGQILIKDYDLTGNYFDERWSSYGGKYPYNQTLTTKSGHAIEIDDTPGAERIHIYHKSGTYSETASDGSTVSKTMENSYEIYLADKKVKIHGDVYLDLYNKSYIYANGEIDLTANKHVKMEAWDNVTLRVAGNLDCEVGMPLEDGTIKGGDVNAEIRGNLNALVEKDVKLKVDGKLEAYSKGDAQIKTDSNFFLDAAGNINIKAGGVVNIDGQIINLNSGPVKMPSFNLPVYNFDKIIHPDKETFVPKPSYDVFSPDPAANRK